MNCKMTAIRQKFESYEITDIKQVVFNALMGSGIREKIEKGPRIAVCAGSRGIDRIDQITRCTIDALKQMGASPFIVPAMGSHGNATAEGQTAILAHYGISEETMGVPVEASMETVFLGETENHIPVWFSKSAYEADWVLPINRIKVHTDFEGPVESGMIKMLTIGLGKEKGASALHKMGTSAFGTILPEAGKMILETGKVCLGIAILANGYDRTAVIKAVEPEDFLVTEQVLLRESMRMLPAIPFSKVDVLVIENFGKNISGAGMDPNVTGRSSAVGGKSINQFKGPDIQRIVVLHLTKESEGNACAISEADFITREFYEQIDFKATYTNCLAGCNPKSAQIPVIMESDEDAIDAAIACCRGIDEKKPRIVRICDTLTLDRMQISEALLQEARVNPDIEILD